MQALRTPLLLALTLSTLTGEALAGEALSNMPTPTAYLSTGGSPVLGSQLIAPSSRPARRRTPLACAAKYGHNPPDDHGSPVQRGGGRW
jgi:hypothetical protein